MFTSLITTLIAALKALTSFLNVAPLFLAWRITSECEQLTHEIIQLENTGTPASRARADELRINLTYRRKLHATLLPSDAGAGSGNSDSNQTRSVQGSSK